MTLQQRLKAARKEIATWGMCFYTYPDGSVIRVRDAAPIACDRVHYLKYIRVGHSVGQRKKLLDKVRDLF